MSIYSFALLNSYGGKSSVPRTVPTETASFPLRSQVKEEFVKLYIRYAPLWQKEERERCQRWSGLLQSFAQEGGPQNLAR